MNDEVKRSVSRGTPIGRYLALSELGRGGAGIVVEAFDPELDRRVALKLLTIDGGRQRQELSREARVLAKFTHPNIASVFDIGATEEWVYIAMELVEGGDLVAWLGARERSKGEILGAFLDAGQGLIAAHAKGLVHRDFKPSNVLIGDGRVRVSDFGLAQIDPQTRAGLGPGDPLRGLVETQPSYGGTPGFVAPEVERGQLPDARADQFAFCVSLLWALTGEMRGEAQELDAALARRGLSSRARRALLRGLDDDPEARFPSVEALLVELRRDVTRRSRLALGGLVGSTSAAAVALALALGGAFGGEDRCDPGSAALIGTWSPARARQLADKLAESTAPAALSGWVTSWSRAHDELCVDEDTPMTRARLRCLDGALAELDALSRAFEEADGDVVERAADAVARLSQPEACLRPGWRPPPSTLEPSPSIAEAVEAAEEDLLMAEAYQRAGESSRAIARAEAARDVGDASGYAPLLAAAHYIIGRSQMDEGRYDDAELTLRAAFAAALAAGDDSRLLKTASLLLYCVGFSRGDAEGGALWQTLSAAALERAGGGTDLEANYWDAQGAFAMVQGDHVAARSAYERALELRRQLFPPQHPELAWSISGLAAIDVEELAFVDAERRSREVLELRERALGPEHPDLIVSHTTLAAALTSQGKHDEAISVLERALAIGEAKLGVESPRLVGARSNLASALNRRGEYGRAKELYLGVLAHFEATRDADDPLVGLAHNNLGGSYLKLDDPGRALIHHRRALEIWEARFGREHPKIGLVLNAIAADLVGLDRCPEADAAIEEARSILAEADPKSVLLAYVANTRAKVLLCRGRASEAEEASREALLRGEASLGAGASQLAAFMITRARALIDLRRPGEARSVAEAAAALAEEGAKERAEALLCAARAARDDGDESAAGGLARDAAAALGDAPRARLRLEIDLFTAQLPARVRN